MLIAGIPGVLVGKICELLGGQPVVRDGPRTGRPSRPSEGEDACLANFPNQDARRKSLDQENES